MNEFAIAFLAFIIIILTIYFLRCKGSSTRKSEDLDNLYIEKSRLISENSKLKYDIEQLNKIKFADENIFTLIKCINSPKKQVCTEGNQTGGGTEEGGERICRSRFVDCTKFKRFVEDDEVASYRLRLAMDT